MTLSVAQRAIIHLDLVRELPVYAVSDLLRVVDEVYLANVYIDLSLREAQSLSGIGRFTPNGDQALYTHRVEIGTPNFAEILGLTQPLIHTCSFIGAALGVSKVGVSILKTWAETQKVKAEIKKLVTETENLSLESKHPDLISRTLPEMTKADAEHLERLQAMLHAVSEKLLKKYVSAIELHVVEETAGEDPPMQHSSAPAGVFRTSGGARENVVIYEQTSVRKQSS